MFALNDFDFPYSIIDIQNGFARSHFRGIKIRLIILEDILQNNDSNLQIINGILKRCKRLKKYFASANSIGIAH